MVVMAQDKVDEKCALEDYAFCHWLYEWKYQERFGLLLLLSGERKVMAFIAIVTES
jgi:hypothetical protein